MCIEIFLEAGILFRFKYLSNISMIEDFTRLFLDLFFLSRS